MRIAIVGSGNVGQALAAGWHKAGHQVTFGMRDATGDKAAGLTRQGFAVAAIADAVAPADAVVLATPWTGIEATVASLGALGGKILIDAINPIGPGFELMVGHTDSAAETIARLAPDAKVVKAFNTTGANNMADSAYPGAKLMMTVAGDDADAKQKVMGLAADLGFEPVDAGPLAMSRHLEPMAMVWIKLALVQKLGRNIGFALLHRT